MSWNDLYLDRGKVAFKNEFKAADMLAGNYYIVAFNPITLVTMMFHLVDVQNLEDAKLMYNDIRKFVNDEELGLMDMEADNHCFCYIDKIEDGNLDVYTYIGRDLNFIAGHINGLIKDLVVHGVAGKVDFTDYHVKYKDHSYHIMINPANDKLYAGWWVELTNDSKTIKVRLDDATDKDSAIELSELIYPYLLRAFISKVSVNVYRIDPT